METNIDRWIVTYTDGYLHTQMAANIHRWILVDTNIHRWILIYTYGYLHTQMDTNIHRWILTYTDGY